MEDVISYAPSCSVAVGEKRGMGEMSSVDSFLIPEKRQLSMINTFKAIVNSATRSSTQATSEQRGEKRSASELIPKEPVREPTAGEIEEREIVKRISARVLAFSKDTSDAKTCFHGVNEPGIAFAQYAERLVHYANVWAREKPSANSQGIRCALLAVEYLERVQVKIAPKSIHRLFLIAFLLGIKLTDDFGMSNTFWGRAGGCVLDDVNRMEIEFCKMLKWDFGVKAEVFESQKQKYAF